MANDPVMDDQSASRGVAVYCASSMGAQRAYQHAALSVGQAIARSNRTLVYGGGKNGLMGVVSGAAIQAGGEVTGIIPYAFIAAGGEADKTGERGTTEARAAVAESKDDRVCTVIVNSMHERKIEMTKRSCGFIALPGGYGTWEEVMEAVTWNQLGIHCKPIVILNVLSYYTPLRQLIRNGIQEGLIPSQNKHLLVFVDCPSSDPENHEDYDWGRAAINALEAWQPPTEKHFTFDWTLKVPGPDGEPRRQTVLDSV